METISAFDFEILYYLGKANVVANALSRYPAQTAQLNWVISMMTEYRDLAIMAECDITAL